MILLQECTKDKHRKKIHFASLVLTEVFLCVSVSGGDQHVAGPSSYVGAEAGGVRGPAQGTRGTGPEDADGVSGPTGRVRGEIETTTRRQRSADEGHHKQVGHTCVLKNTPDESR